MSWMRGVDALLTQQIGLDPGTVGESLITRGLQTRMSALGLTDRDQYERLLEGSGAELQELIEEVVVPESWFFRDERPFFFLKDLVRSGWVDQRDRPPLRALSLPCAAGEEPYSIAMALLEAGLLPTRFQVDAVDISERCLARARTGIYSRNAFRAQDLSFQSRYFRELPAGFELDASVRATVRFVRGNLVDPGLLAHERPYDVIFCRNLLIYLTESARAQASATLLRLLALTGVLFLGHADRLETSDLKFSPVGDKGTFAHRRESGEPTRSDRSLPPPLSPKRLGPPAAAARLDMNARQPARPTVAARPFAGRVVRSEEPGGASGRPVLAPRPAAPEPHKSGPSPACPELDRAAELAGQARHDDAIALCEKSLRESGPSAAAYFLLGMIRQAAGDREQAEAAFQKTVYLDAQHDEALLALALLAERRGDGVSAVGYRRRAERALARKGAR